MKDGPESYGPFVFINTMDLEPGKSSGVHTDDIFRILCGQVKNDIKHVNLFMIFSGMLANICKT